MLLSIIPGKLNPKQANDSPTPCPFPTFTFTNAGRLQIIFFYYAWCMFTMSEGLPLNDLVIEFTPIPACPLHNISDGKFAFELVEPDQPAYIFKALSYSEKREWMSALTWLLTESTFERLLDAKLREEEKTIPILRPDSNKYM